MKNQKSYGQVLKSSSIMGGAAVINMLFQMVRVKFAAVLLGTLGVGVLSNLMVIQNFIGTLSSLGVSTSAVKSIAEAAESKNMDAVSEVVLTLKRVVWLTGFFGAALIFFFSSHLSMWVFSVDTYALDISLLGAAIFFSAIASGNMAVIQGMRRIADLAKIQVVSGFLGTIIVVTFYIIKGVDGIAAGLVSAALIQLLVSYYFSRNIALPAIKISWFQSISSAGSMVRLGIAFMWVNLLAVFVLLITNTLIANEINIEAVGIFSAAFALSGMFVNFVLTAMQADYYPRLVGVALDKNKMNALVNEQSEIGLLLVVPGLLFTLSLAPWIVQLFYASAFLPAVDLLQWFVLGCLIRVIQWPMGFLQVALGKAKLFAFTQTLFGLTHLILIWVGLQVFGLIGVSLAFVSLSVFSLAVIYYISRQLTGFVWSPALVRMGLVLIAIVLLVFLIVHVFPVYVATLLGLAISIASSVYCLRKVILLVGKEHRIAKLSKKYIGVFVHGV